MLLQTQYTNNQIKLLAFLYCLFCAGILCTETACTLAVHSLPLGCRSLVEGLELCAGSKPVKAVALNARQFAVCVHAIGTADRAGLPREPIMKAVRFKKVETLKNWTNSHSSYFLLFETLLKVSNRNFKGSVFGSLALFTFGLAKERLFPKEWAL